MAERFRAIHASSAPAPHPTTAAMGSLVRAAAIALADVVFPMPISPKPRRSHPAIAESQASSTPASRAAVISDSVMAGASQKLRVPGAERRLIRLLEIGSGVATPTSTIFNSIHPDRAN